METKCYEWRFMGLDVEKTQSAVAAGLMAPCDLFDLVLFMLLCTPGPGNHHSQNSLKKILLFDLAPQAVWACSYFYIAVYFWAL